MAPFPKLPGGLFKSGMWSVGATPPGPPLLWKKIHTGAGKYFSVQRLQPQLVRPAEPKMWPLEKVGGADEEGGCRAVTNTLCSSLSSRGWVRALRPAEQWDEGRLFALTVGQEGKGRRSCCTSSPCKTGCLWAPQRPGQKELGGGLLVSHDPGASRLSCAVRLGSKTCTVWDPRSSGWGLGEIGLGWISGP